MVQKTRNLNHTEDKEDNMPRSKVRGGRKAHNKRVKQRNEEMKGFWQRQVNMAYEKHEEWKKAKSGQTEQVQINVK
jgi:hypothetical protein